mmetsp:Transcript_33742/g.32783  ORF Transcript_33742/g.32783 Transcript_33742/m.32783 type:complete len:211 (+) Transcript_33742:1758-2390(+)
MYYSIIQKILGREELSLFGVSLKDLDLSNNIYEHKVQVASFYQKFLYQCLEDCLQKFCRKDVEPYIREYLEYCLTVTFYRVPEFQELFIKSILEKSDEPIQEWRGVDWDIHDAYSREQLTHNSMLFFFDWESLFYKLIPNNEESKENGKILRRIIYKDTWQTRLKKRTLAFFQIIKKQCEIIHNFSRTVSVNWQDIPGYKQMLRAMIMEM